MPRTLWGFLRIEVLAREPEPEAHEVLGPSGARYAIETEVLWDDEAAGTTRVMVALDDGGPSAERPMVDDFVVASDGTFVDE